MVKQQMQRFYDSVIWPLRFLVILWVIQIIQAFTPLSFYHLGVYPGKIWGLKGILFMPLIHGDFGHLLSNSLPFLSLSVMILFFYRKIAWPSFFVIYFLSGVLVWLTGFFPIVFGPSNYHIGASGVIYGLAAFLFGNGIFRRNAKAIALALIVVLYYGSMIWGIIPGREGISWQGHLMGGIAGLLTSFWFKGVLEKDEEPKRYDWELLDEQARDDAYFLDRDAFDKTKQQKAAEKADRDRSSWFSSNTWD